MRTGKKTEGIIITIPYDQVIKNGYVRAVRAVRSGLATMGLLAPLNRLASRSRVGAWLRSLLAIYDAHDLMLLDLPWWTFNASVRVEKFLASRPGARVFEWGPGASTLWLARRSGSVTAVEHDADWASDVSIHFPDNVTLLLVPPLQVKDTSTLCSSSKKGCAGLDFSEYVTVIDRIGGAFDLIVLDGRARASCLTHAVEHLASTGMIVFDNVERVRYRDAIAAMGSRVVVEWTHGLTPCLPYPTRTALIFLANP